MICPNRSCEYRQRYGAPAEWPDGTRSCPACGAPLAAERGGGADPPEYPRPVTVAEFGEPHEAHLAKGRLEAEGVAAQVAGEHLASLHALFADTGGLIRIEVAPQDVDRALDILERDHSGAIVDEEGADRSPPSAAAVCPRCGSAAVEMEDRAGGGLLAGLLSALRGRRARCLTCGRRWKEVDPAV